MPTRPEYRSQNALSNFYPSEMYGHIDYGRLAKATNAASAHKAALERLIPKQHFRSLIFGRIISRDQVIIL